VTYSEWQICEDTDDRAEEVSVSAKQQDSSHSRCQLFNVRVGWNVGVSMFQARVSVIAPIIILGAHAYEPPFLSGQTIATLPDGPMIELPSPPGAGCSSLHTGHFFLT